MVLAGGAVQAVLNAKRDFRSNFDMSAGARRLMAPIMRFGLVMHGLVNLAVGTSILIAAARANVVEVRSLGELSTSFRPSVTGAPCSGSRRSGSSLSESAA